MTDWAVWPIFFIQIIALFLLFLKEGRTFLSIHPRTIILGILLVSCGAIAISLYHDSSSTLNLYF